MSCILSVCVRFLMPQSSTDLTVITRASPSLLVPSKMRFIICLISDALHFFRHNIDKKKITHSLSLREAVSIFFRKWSSLANSTPALRKAVITFMHWSVGIVSPHASWGWLPGCVARWIFRNSVFAGRLRLCATCNVLSSDDSLPVELWGGGRLLVSSLGCSLSLSNLLKTLATSIHVCGTCLKVVATSQCG